MSNRGGPFPNLDAYRGIGMIMVMTNHVAFSSNLRNKHEVLNTFFARFDLSIPVFFMVSGFLLFRPYAKSLLDDRPVPATGPYLQNRALRILPAYWAAMIGVFIWYGIPHVDVGGVFGMYPGGTIAFYALMLQTFQASTVFAGYEAFDQAWSIGTEVTFYLLLPLLGLALARRTRGGSAERNVKTLLALCAVLWAVAQVWRTGLVIAQPTWIASATFWLPANIDFFAIGMAMATIEMRHRLGAPLPNPVAWLAARPWASWAIAAAIWLIVVNPFQWAYLDGLFVIRTNPLDFSEEYVAKQFLYGFVGFFYLLPATFGPQHEGAIRRTLGSRPLAALGTISLGFYLWHKAWLGQAESWTDAQPFNGDFLKLWVITFLGALLCGIASYAIVERPFLRLKPARSRRRAGDHQQVKVPS